SAPVRQSDGGSHSFDSSPQKRDIASNSIVIPAEAGTGLAHRKEAFADPCTAAPSALRYRRFGEAVVDAFGERHLARPKTAAEERAAEPVEAFLGQYRVAPHTPCCL